PRSNRLLVPEEFLELLGIELHVGFRPFIIALNDRRAPACRCHLPGIFGDDLQTQGTGGDATMTHGTEHHLEHAEHVQHHAHDPFDRRVAMTMAIVAAVLACGGMLSHRTHNETLKLHIMANDDITEASTRWGYYQAKHNRGYQYHT